MGVGGCECGKLCVWEAVSVRVQVWETVSVGDCECGRLGVCETVSGRL